MRLRALIAVALAATTLATNRAPAQARSADHQAVANERPDVADPARRLYVVTDSVGLGAVAALPRAFPPDWEITLDGDAGEFTETMESKYVRPRLTTTPGVFGDHAVVALGYNYPYWDPARFDRSIDTMIATLLEAGVKHVHWVTLREVEPQYVTPAGWRQIQPYYWYFPRVNEHLRLALERHPNLSLVDWAAVADQTGLTYDAIHLNPVGSALYSQIVRESVVAASTRAPDGSITRVTVPDAGGIGAVAVNVTTTDPRTASYLTAWNCEGPPPTASFHNSVRGEIVAHSTIVPINAAGEFCVLTRSASNLIVDLTGRFPIGGGYRPVGPLRWADTRQTGNRVPSGGSLTVDLGTLPGVDAAQVTAVAISVTATGGSGPGYLVASGSCAGNSVTTSNVNYTGADSIPNLAIVEPDANGQVCISALTETDVVVDLLGVFAGAVTAGTPQRVFDSRLVGNGDVVPAGGEVRVPVTSLGVPGGAGGVVVNVTTALARAPGFASIYPCAAGRPNASQVNMPDPRAASNAGIVASDVNNEICVFTSAPSHLVVDVMGSLGAAFEGVTPTRLLDTRLR